MDAFCKRSIEVNDKEVTKMIKQFEGNESARKKLEKIFIAEEENPMVAAGVLDKFLNNLPTPLIPEDNWKEFLTINGT